MMVRGREDAAVVLANRARELARPVAAPTPAVPMIEVLCFSLGAERFGLDTGFVREIARSAELTRVPGAPQVIAGLSAVRGDILAAVDLTALIPVPRPPGPFSWIIVCGTAQAEFGLLADTVENVATIPVSQLLEPPRPGGLAHSVARDGLVVLDAAALISDSRLFIDYRTP
ncbi:MAG: purine-binding chemotaxis protein CheW [Alphaproteobacteria bacterium]|nr:purine-binding chemotaxis protein CheW [Alphaproteobacteria bacterium]